MRKKLSLALAAILTVSAMILPAGAAGARFKDVPEGHWAYESIEYAVDHGYFSGTGEDTFSPDGTMTRAMLWTVLASMAGENTAAEPGQPWYQGGQNWAKENGISDGSNPNGNITREQFATMLYNFAEHTGESTNKDNSVLNQFSDRNSIASYAVDAMAWAVTNGIVSGTSSTTITPAGLATRAQAAVMLMRFDKMGEEPTDPEEPNPPVVDYETKFGASEVPPYHGNTVKVGEIGRISISSNPYRANIEAGVTYTVTSSDTSVATLSRDSLDLNAVSYYVQGVNPGTATITAVGSDGFKGSLVITVEGEDTENPDTENPDVDWGEYAELKQEVVRLINEERSRIGLNELEVSAKVMQAADIRANECAEWQFTHTRPNGTSYNTVFKDVGLSSSGGEILARGYSGASTVVEAWIASPGHYKTMTKDKYNYIGIGIAVSADGSYNYSVLCTIAGD